ncbi:unnamed protein product [Rangifer tarandus platyrhynchus]|uniref:Uncharacterized protein n=1 Tax=Rangifer tarandus platyrhynchus TaxID=3082113 RepID=A0ABN8YVI7_RANTA|nr:unnamed protein product [Rangifer tarandus platyrhynchus]
MEPTSPALADGHTPTVPPETPDACVFGFPSDSGQQRAPTAAPRALREVPVSYLSIRTVSSACTDAERLPGPLLSLRPESRNLKMLLAHAGGSWPTQSEPGRFPVQKCLGCAQRKCRGGHSTHRLLAPWWSSPVRSRLAARRPRPLRAGPANHRRFQTGPVKGRFSSSPPPTDILGDTVRKENIFLK